MRGYGTIWEAIKAVVAADYCDERGEGTIIELEDGSFTGHVTDEGTLSEHMTDEQREQGVELMLTPAGIVEAPPYFSVMQNAGTTWLTERGVAEGRDCKYLVPVALNIPGALASPAFSMPDGIELALTQDGQVSDPVKSDYGWHIIKRVSTEPAREIPYADVQTALDTYEQAAYQQEYYNDITAEWMTDESLITRYPENYASIGKS